MAVNLISAPPGSLVHVFSPIARLRDLQVSPELLRLAHIENLENKLLCEGFKKAGNDLSQWLQGALIMACAQQDVKIAGGLIYLTRDI